MSALLATCSLLLLLSSVNHAKSPPANLICSSMKMNDRPWCLPENYEDLEPPVKENEKMELEFIFTIEEVRGVDDEQETIQIEMYLERQWKDERIEINTENPRWSRTGELPLSLGVLDHLWKPFITIHHLVDFKKHVVIEDLAGLKINKDKTIKHSIQALITLSCPMDFQMYPFDHHYCNFMIRSYNHQLDQMTCKSTTHYNDKTQKRKLQFNVSIHDLDEQMRVTVPLSDEEAKFATCGFEVRLGRKLVTLVYQVYIPLHLFVFISWVSFIIPPDIIPGRFGGLIVLFLITVNTFNSTKSKTNMTTGLNNLDAFTIACIFFIFFAILEYTYILIIRNTYNKNEKKVKEEFADETSVFESFIEDISDEVKKIKSASGFRQKLSVTLTQTRLLDAISGIVFPTMFIIFSLIYWLYICVTITNYMFV